MTTFVQAQAAEAHRRLQLLGTTVEDSRGTLLGVRARQVGIPEAVLRQWHACYLRRGLDALVPTEWSELPESAWALIERRYAALGGLAEAETITVEDIRRLAERAGWTMRQAHGTSARAARSRRALGSATRRTLPSPRSAWGTGRARTRL